MTTKERNQIETNKSFPSADDGTKSRPYNPGMAFLVEELSDNDTFLVVCRALFSGDHEVAIGAALVLGRMKAQRAVPYLLRALLTTDQKRAEAVMWSLGEIGDETAIPFLLNALSANFIPRSAILALGKIGSPKTVDAILESLGDTDEAVRLLAVKAIGQIRFGRNDGLISRASHSLSMRLTHEASRRVKLLLAVVKSRLEKSLEQ